MLEVERGLVRATMEVVATMEGIGVTTAIAAAVVATMVETMVLVVGEEMGVDLVGGMGAEAMVGAVEEAIDVIGLHVIGIHVIDLTPRRCF